MSENDNSQNHTELLSTPSRSVPWWKKPWITGVILVILAGGGYIWWAKPAFLFKTQGAADGRAGSGGSAGPTGGGGFGGGGFGGPGGRRGGQTAPVGAAKARTADVNIYIPALGSVTAANTATVRARIDGLVLLKLNFKEGQTVKEGQLLAQLDPRAAQVQLSQAQGQLARDAALLQNGKVDLERYRKLLAQDSIAKQQLDTQESLVRQQEATVKIDQANVDAAKLQLSYTQVIAPISGRVGLKQVDVGNVVHTSDVNGVAIITQVQPINVVFTIPEVNIARVLQQLQGGAAMPVEAWDRDQKNMIASGELITADNQIDATTGTIKLKAKFNNDDLALFPNQFVNIKLLMDVRHGATVVPTAAVLRGTDGPFVYVVKPDKSVTVRQVRTGAVQGDDTMIIRGVEPGEVVVIDGTDRLREGMKVESIVRAEQPVEVGVKQPRRGRNGQGGPGGFGGGNRPMNPDGTPRQRPDGQVVGSQGFGGNRPANPDGTPRQRPTNPDGTPRQWPKNPDGTPRQFPGGGFGGNRQDNAPSAAP